ncbi:zinc-binding dehydrogenase, partial [Burkholderia pseudomallei]
MTRAAGDARASPAPRAGSAAVRRFFARAAGSARLGAGARRAARRRPT